MNGSSQKTLTLPVSADSATPPAIRSFLPFILAVGALVLCFAQPLISLVRFSLSNELFSHILLIPFISAYLFWTERSKLPRPNPSGLSLASIIPALLGVSVFAVYFLMFRSSTLPKSDRLFFTILPFYCFLVAICFGFLGTHFCRAIAFPLGFLVFLLPFPERMVDAMEIASQHASADAYSWMMSLSQATYFRDGLIFSLPGLNIQVAQECSGIRSSLVLFITSLLAGQMFLRSGWRKAFLALFVIPLGVLRNGFRIWVLSMLTVHWDPRVIDSPLHHKGGPIFFVISLVPFFALLFWLRRSERSAVPSVSPTFSASR